MAKALRKKIVFIGSGNVATCLGSALQGKYTIVQIYSRTLENARTLAEKLGCPFTNDLKKITKDADLYIIAVKDDVLEGVCKKLKLNGKMVIHTSGATSIDVLKGVSERCGVMWPMYSFAGGNILKPFPAGMPFFVEALDEGGEKVIEGVVKDLRGVIYRMDSEKRAKVHMTAVFVNNFPNYLFGIAEVLCKEAGVPFKLFLPLARETVENVGKQGAAKSQTGPASRNERNIIKRHLALLKGHEMYREIYKVLTESIIKRK